MCPELEPATWFLRGKDKLEMLNLELDSSVTRDDFCIQFIS